MYIMPLIMYNSGLEKWL